MNGWLIWGVAALFYSYEFLLRVSPSIMIPQLKLSFDTSLASLGHMAAFYFYAYALFQVPAGVLCDRYGVRLILTLACLLVALGCLLLGLAPNIPFACMSRFIIGAGSAFAFVSCLKLATFWLKNQYFPLIVGLTNLCGMVGAILGGEPLALSLQIVDWREIFFLLGLFGILNAFLIWFIVKDSPKNIERAPNQANTNVFNGILYVIKKPHAWLLAMYGMLLVVPIAAFGELWGVEFFKTSYGIPSEDSAKVLRYIFLGIAVGGPSIGWLRNHIHSFKAVLILGCLLTLGTMVCIIYVDGWSYTALCILLFIYGFATSHMLICFSIANQAFPIWAQGAALGFINMMIMGGAATFQPLIGKLLDLDLSTKQSPIYQAITLADFRYALSVLPCCIVIALFLALFIKERPMGS